MAVLRIINNTSVDVFIMDVGVIIPASGEDTFTNPNLVRDLASSKSLRDLVAALTLKLNDGTNDIPVAQADGFLLSFFVTGGSASGIPLDTALVVEDRVIPISDLVGVDVTQVLGATVNGRSYAGWNLPDGIQTRRQIAVPTPPGIDDKFDPALALTFIAPTDSLSAGNASIQTEIAYRAAGSVAADGAAYDLTQTTLVPIPSTGASQNALVKTLIPFSVASALPIPGAALISIARLGAAPGDTYTGNLILVAALFRFRRKAGP